jgi:N-acetylglucosaminyl-diphospho-decaprenol L-rhamnosyltransferase
MSVKTNVNVIIVNYRTPELTVKCIESIIRMGIVSADAIYVVENASPDDSACKLAGSLPGVKIILAERNGGFSAGVNLAAAQASREYLLVLNPDTYFVDSSVDHALLLLEKRPDVGLVGLELVYPDGRLQYSARRFYCLVDVLARRSPLGKFWPLSRCVEEHMMVSAWTSGQPFEADWVMGTGFIVRRNLFNRIGCMDEAYFLYMEDVDLCARVWEAGSKVMCVPGARLVHDHQRSSAGSPFSRHGVMHLKSLARFRKKYRMPLLFPPASRLLKLK